MKFWISTFQPIELLFLPVLQPLFRICSGGIYFFSLLKNGSINQPNVVFMPLEIIWGGHQNVNRNSSFPQMLIQIPGGLAPVYAFRKGVKSALDFWVGQKFGKKRDGVVLLRHDVK
jgi:hypothetical protein